MLSAALPACMALLCSAVECAVRQSNWMLASQPAFSKVVYQFVSEVAAYQEVVYAVVIVCRDGFPPVTNAPVALVDTAEKGYQSVEVRECAQHHCRAWIGLLA